MIFAECYGDQALLNYLGHLEVEHSFGIGNIFKKLEKSKNQIALIDEDPGKTKPNYNKFLKELENKYAVKVRIDRERNNLVVSIDPDLEGFLLEAFKENQCAELLKKHGIPNTKEELHQFLSTEKNAKKLPKFLTEMEAIHKSKRLETLRDALKNPDFQ